MTKVSIIEWDAEDYLSDKAVAWLWIDVSIIWPAWNQQLEISNTWVVSITSDDWSITITDKWDWVIDLSWCCTDEMVKVTSTDTTHWYLLTKIDVDSTMTKTLQNVWWNETLLLWVDIAWLNIPNNKVSVKSGQTAWYLEDVIIVWVWLAKSTVWADVKIDIDSTAARWKRPFARRTLTNTFSESLAIWWTYTWPIINPSVPYFWSGWDIYNDAAMVASTDIIKITKTWYYRMFVNGTIEINDGIAAFRIYFGYWSTEYPLDVRYWWPSDTWMYGTWNSRSLGKRLQRFNVSGMNYAYLTAWTNLACVVKISTEVDVVWDPIVSSNWRFRLLASWDSIDDSWFAFWCEFIWDVA